MPSPTAPGGVCATRAAIACCTSATERAPSSCTPREFKPVEHLVQMRVDQAGDDGPSVQLDHLRSRPGQCGHGAGVAHRDEAAVADRHRLRDAPGAVDA